MYEDYFNGNDESPKRQKRQSKPPKHGTLKIIFRKPKYKRRGLRATLNSQKPLIAAETQAAAQAMAIERATAAARAKQKEEEEERTTAAALAVAIQRRQLMGVVVLGGLNSPLMFRPKLINN